MTLGESPATPDSSAQQSSCFSPQVTPLQPQPRRAVPAQLNYGLVQLGGTPSSPLCASMWAGSDDGEAPCEQRELWGRAPSDAKRAAATVASSVSTSAGLTPSPDAQEHAPVIGGGGRGPTPGGSPPPPREAAPQGARPTKEVQTQGRKIFVGGVPQDMSEEDLHQVFSDYWVKKAWLQQGRADANGLRRPSASGRSHRGFGFVIFYGTDAVDQILGTADAKFISLKEGRFEGKQIEVKRAVSSNEIVTGGWAADQPQAQSRRPAGQAPPTRWAWRQAQSERLAKPAEAPPSPLPDQQSVPAAFPTRPAQAFCMYRVACGGVQAMMPQMHQASHMPQISTMHQMCLPQIPQMAQMASVAHVAYSQMGPCGKVHDYPIQGMATCGQACTVQQPMALLQQPSLLPQNQHGMPQQCHVLAAPFPAAAAAAAATSLPAAAP
ncbi:unnamed protein product [Prorocentrum cordatum]|uniref:RRM domain-containing protein n=1 Tax=Prorocentrum cordatum TaxID=2364126 RepID=A0ABN9XWP5_9DINO|nr:unnamed protein product [Polarella glacialis]